MRSTETAGRNESSEQRQKTIAEKGEGSAEQRCLLLDTKRKKEKSAQTTGARWKKGRIEIGKAELEMGKGQNPLETQTKKGRRRKEKEGGRGKCATLLHDL